MDASILPLHCLKRLTPRSLLLLLTSAALLVGCTRPGGVFRGSTANSRAGIIRATKFVDTTDKDGTLFWSHFDATKRSSIINATSEGTTVLAEVTPDAAVQKSLDLLGKAKVLDKVDAETQLKTASTIAQLGQRTANVNMLRDALYRIAEGANNRPDAFYTCGCVEAVVKPEVIKADSTKPASPKNPAENPAKKKTKKEAKEAKKEATTPAVAKPAPPTISRPTANTMYERLFLATLSTYETAVKAEADKAKADADKAKAEAEKAKAEAAAKPKDKPATDSTATTKPAAAGDSTASTEVNLKLDLLAKTTPVKKKVKGTKEKAKK